ncbi:MULTISPECIES: galactose-1-phosphate uridylyltransferase [unclassified Streptomyces]|uniref:galactose-1-phosphate uridylyltransferase n=1 Tax=unclassified Streptomyces TaxID=2593676 RepID=UPI001660B622|nr:MULTISPECIES: galactose-1-phosphate uridylyltransferase [unclassified Streptomyces]MBD0710754.1 galactose-1-phosphate uridylyltransferase [Streptomyces sp. CBMA291]MBD0717065.1 galactose-1-phosphate uridylyltransferase [Streptomyces sp. CBMA370]
MKKTVTTLADGRELIYYDARDDTDRTAVDPRTLAPVVSRSEIRRDPLTGDPVVVASHRQTRTHLPPADACPLCPARPGHESEIPEEGYEVAVFENRFPSLSGGVGRCEVVCFTDDHTASFADLTEERAALVLDAWTDRTAALFALPGVEQVYCFENRGREIGVTLPHAHGQIYAFPYVTPRTAAMRRRIDEHRAETGRNLFDDVVEAERAEGERVVLETEHWIAFVPYAAHWPYEVHLHPRRRVPDLLALDGAARAEFARVYLELLRRFDRIFGPDEPPTPYISAWHQAPFTDPRREDFGLHLELFTVRRASGKLKYLAGTESGMGAFMNDIRPEDAARRLREVAGIG